MLTVKHDDLLMMRWHLVLCKPNQHHIAHKSLSRLDCDVFMPRHQVQRRWRGRVIEEARPVFAGYIFVGMDPRRPIWQATRSAQGVSQIIGFGEMGPATVPAEVVAGLMARCDVDGFLQSNEESFAVGDKVRIISGPFAEFITSIDKIDANLRLHVLLDLLGRPTRVTLDPAMATKNS